MRVGRRSALLGGAALAGAALLETASLRGAFDHRSFTESTARARWDTTLRALPADAIVHVGHSTHLLVSSGVRILTDPWFFDPAFGALAHSPAVRPEEIGPLDAVLVSHDHPDHADLRAMDRLDKRAVVVVGTRELAARVRAVGFADVNVLAPWDSLAVRGVSVAGVPALHDVPEIGFVVGAEHNCVYFAGDSRIHPDLAAIAERFAPRAAILPVDGTRIAGSALQVMTPEDAVTAARLLRSVLVMPSHADAVFSDPLAGGLLATTIEGARAKFRDAMARALPAVRCEVPDPGAAVVL